jgi:methyltransferase-like protein/2-polyprenyl-3-methyl-5-hydroxy-6-metoxy-1,4-benzoquinol methylase
MPADTSNSYDGLPYGSLPHEDSHPRWLATVAALFGHSAPPPDGARILELGCATGGNLIPIAESLPNSSCLGIDLSSRQIESGNELVRATGLENIELKQASILDIGPRDGAFDYIICHGVYSWVTPDIQRRILEICGSNLTPNGLAYVSYNIYPGWHMQGMLRGMMKFHAARSGAPAEQVADARALLDVLAKTLPSDGNPYGLFLKRENERLRQSADWYVFHDHLEETNDPVYFHELVERASVAGLQFLGESEVRSMLVGLLPPEIQQALRALSSNLIQAEQYMDFFRNRAFRETILCRQGVPLTRKLDAQRVRSLRFASALRPQAEHADLRRPESLRFQGSGWPTVDVSDPIGKAMLLCLRDVWPQALTLDALDAQVRARLGLGAGAEQSRSELAETIWRSFVQGVVSMTASPPIAVTQAGDRPLGSVVARAQAGSGQTTLTNLLHRSVKLNAFDATVLTLLDGSRSRAALAAHMAQHVVASSETSQPLAPRIDVALAVLAEAALLRA